MQIHSVVIKKNVPLQEAKKHAADILKRTNVPVTDTTHTYRYINIPTHKFIPESFRDKVVNEYITLLIGKLKPSLFGTGASGGIKQTEQRAMSDSDIRNVDPNARIVIYRNLPHTTIEALLPVVGSHVYLLYESSPNVGHWTTLNRDNHGFNYFDSYGHAPDFPIQWSPPELRAQFGEDQPYLSNMLDKASLPVRYNNKDYQAHNSTMATCGRHCCFYTKHMLQGKTLAEYKTMMDQLCKKEKMTPDEIVSKYIAA